MSNSDLIDRFVTEVLHVSPESTLPCNLSDEWLNVLLEQSNKMANLDQLDEEDNSSVCTELLAAVLHILMAKNGFEKVSIEESELLQTIEQYTMELAIEEVSRRTDFKCEPATLETIFTNRQVAVHAW